MPNPFRAAGARILLLAALASPLAGCALSFDARSLGVNATMAAPAGRVVEGDSFAVSQRAIHVFWGLAPARVPSLQNVLAGQLAGAGGVANLRIRVRRRLSDLVFTALTLGVLTSTTVTFEGVVVR